jgi:rhodanese-related sulfurtransferase
MQTLSPQEFKERMAKGAAVVDVRTAEEVQIAALAGAINIPMNELPARISELDPAAPIAVLCHHGMRSEMASRFLERNGFTDVAHLEGGIDAWSVVIDSSVPRY